jgi:hypothetical protein
MKSGLMSGHFWHASRVREAAGGPKVALNSPGRPQKAKRMADAPAGILLRLVAISLPHHDQRQQNGRMEAPSRNGRTASGQFAKGNPGGPGNPHGRRVADLRAALLDAVTEADIRAVAKALVARAKAGEVPAIRELLDRMVGRPLVVDQVEPVAFEVSPEVQARAREIIARRLGVQVEA